MSVRTFAVAGERCYARPEPARSADVALRDACGLLIHGPDLPAATLAHQRHCQATLTFYRWL